MTNEHFCCTRQEHVSNKSAYLCGVMKTYRQKSRAAGQAQGGSQGALLKVRLAIIST